MHWQHWSQERYEECELGFGYWSTPAETLDKLAELYRRATEQAGGSRQLGQLSLAGVP